MDVKDKIRQGTNFAEAMKKGDLEIHKVDPIF